MFKYKRILFFLCCCQFSLTLSAADNCLVVAHRGASGYLPEHTLEAYRLGIEQGADYIEPDVVLTADGVPIVRHEVQLDLTTDVADMEEFADRRSEREIYGRRVSGWFVDDFSLSEIQTLRARERWPDVRTASASHDGRYSVPTLEQVVGLANATPEEVGLYVEFKNAAYFAERNMDIVAKTVEVLARAQVPVILQSFEPPALKRAAEISSYPRVQLLFTDKGLDLGKIASYAQGIGYPKTDFSLDYEQAKKLGLMIHAYTFRQEARFLPEQYEGDLVAEIKDYLGRGMTGFFTDQPDLGRLACDG